MKPPQNITSTVIRSPGCVRNHWRTFILLIVSASLAGCVSPADPQAMVPTNVTLGKKFNKSVSIAVTGGQTTNPLWSSQVANEDFATALQSTIERHGLFSRVLRTAGGDYQLDVRLVQLRQPMAGFNMTVQAEVEWRLRQVSSGKMVWEEKTNRSYTATVGDAFAGVTRLKLANEGAIRENIKTGLERIATLAL
jgi:hypothetical protein